MKKNKHILKKAADLSKKSKLPTRKPTNNRFLQLLSTKKRFKNAVIALSSSLVIGITFGFIFLTMVKQEEPQSASTLHSTTNDTEEVQTQQATEKQVEPMPFYVVQAGVFSEQENADKWGKQFTELSFPAITWERDGQYFVLAGLGSTEAAARKLVDKMDEHQLEVFVKQWEIDAYHGELSGNEVQFLQLFVQIWSDSLKTFENEGKIETSDWEALKSFDGLSEQIAAFQEKIEDTVNEMDKNSSIEQLFLQLIYEYEKLS